MRSGGQGRDRSGARTIKRVLVVDDEPTVVQLLKEAFGSFQHGHTYKVEIAHDGADALIAPGGLGSLLLCRVSRAAQAANSTSE